MINGDERGFDAYEGRLVTAIEIVFEGSQPDASAEASFLAVLKVVPNTEFSAVRVRDSLQALFDTQRVANARVEVIEAAGRSGPIRLRFVIHRQVQISEVNFEIGPSTGLPVTSDELTGATKSRATGIASLKTDHHSQRRRDSGLSS